MRTQMTRRLREAKDELLALARALRHPRTPWAARLWLVLVLAYAASPIDLIPDPIPVLGLLDDALLLPLGVLVARRLIPDDVLAECRDAASAPAASWLRAAGAVIVLSLWAAFAWTAWWLLDR